MSAPTLKINEIYESIQGESSWAGWRCVFVRLTACDLRCTYCDTEYAFYKGEEAAGRRGARRGAGVRRPLVEITGGEPLLQKNVLPLMTALCDAGRTVLIETSGAHDISQIDPRVHRIMDLKTPGSGECARNLWSNIAHLDKARRGEVRHRLARGLRVVARASARARSRRRAAARCSSRRSSAASSRGEIVEWIVADKLPVRFQLQMHKFIWDPKQKGV